MEIIDKSTNNLKADDTLLIKDLKKNQKWGIIIA